jgi:hypothetical protein
MMSSPMLTPDNRQTLLDALRPEPDERLDAAVVTTFTLDLLAALVPPMAFASFAARDPGDPITAMEAVRQANERIDIFCQAGMIRAPRQAVDLVAFLEPMVHEVRQPRPGRLFHPKFWLLRYTTTENDRYRLLCLSRNLTDERSWDTVVRLDGARTNKRRPENEPLARLVAHLPDLALRQLPAERADRVRALASECRSVEWEPPEGVTEIRTHAFGVPGLASTADFTGDRHLAISPFCTDGGIAAVTPGSRQRIVVSRPEQLDQLSRSTLDDVESYVLSPAAGLPPEDGSGDEASILSGLHAKAYVIEREGEAHVFLGSMNATEPAAGGGNVELLVELAGTVKELGIDAVLGESPSLRDVLDRYSGPGGAPADPEADEAWRLEEALRVLAQLDFTAAVTPAVPAFDLTVTTAQQVVAPAGPRITIEPLTRPDLAAALADGRALAVTFAGLDLVEVTPFLVLRADAGGSLRRATVVKATLHNDPAGRHNEILARQIDSTEKFLRFVAALLGLTATSTWSTDGPTAILGGAFGWHRGGLFETLVRGLADHPRGIAELDGLIERLATTDRGAQILPPGFYPLWTTFRTALDRLEGAAR